MTINTYNSHNTLIDFKSRKSKCRPTIINYYYNSSNSCNLNDCDVDKLINTISDKFSSNMLKDKLILEYYERLYNEVLYDLDNILSVFKSSTTSEVSKLYNTQTFLSMSVKITSIKLDLIANFCDPDKLPYHVNNFINYYIEHAYHLVCELGFIIEHIRNFDENAKCCKILSSLDNIKEYVKKTYGNNGSNYSSATAATVIDFPISLREPYNTYMNRYGFPDEGCFDPELLGIISIELGLNNN